jgi:hypothetical protein
VPDRTQTFSLFPWTGGVVTNPDPAAIPVNCLIQASNLIFNQGSRRMRDGIDYNADGAGALTHATSNVNWVSAYFWGAQNDILAESAVDYSTMTHIMHFQLEVNNDGTLGETQLTFDGTGTDDAAAELLYRAHLKGVKVLITVGGQGFETQFQGATSPGTIDTFVTNIVEFVTRSRSYAGTSVEYDGVDIDWELIDVYGGQFQALVQKLRVALDALGRAEAPLITCAVCTPFVDADIINIVNGVIDDLDQVNVLTYPFAGDFDVWHINALYASPSISTVMPDFSAVIPASKLGFGIDFDALIFSNQTVPSEGTSVSPSDVTETTYRQVMADYYNGIAGPTGTVDNLAYYWDIDALEPYLSIPTTTPLFITFENETSIIDKLDYASSNGYGVFVFELSGGYRPDYSANPDPLMQQIKTTAEVTPGYFVGDSVDQIAGIDYWYTSGSSKAQIKLTVGSNGTLYKYDSDNARTAITTSGTTWTNPSVACIEILNNTAIVASDGLTNVPKKYTGSGNFTDLTNVTGSPPNFSVCRKHQGRIWANDKTNPDRLHYSETATIETWNGEGDSGALDIGVGDGDPQGITAIFPTFQGVLYVAKKTKLYRVLNDSPENYQIELVSSGIGCVSHNSIVAVDQDDIIFVSEKGVHSLVGTISSGDVQGTYLSRDIQKTFNSQWVKARRKYIWGAYIQPYDAVGFAVTDSRNGIGSNNTIWFYDLSEKGWHSWDGVSCQCLFTADDSDKKRFYMGGAKSFDAQDYGRLAKAITSANFDVAPTGLNSDIDMVIKTGNIYINAKKPNYVYGFKRFGLIFNAVGSYTLNVSFKVDNFEAQTLNFTGSGDLLGTTFILGSSILGGRALTEPQTLSVDGWGRTFQVTITQSGRQSRVDIQGFIVDFEEPTGQTQES